MVKWLAVLIYTSVGLGGAAYLSVHKGIKDPVILAVAGVLWPAALGHKLFAWDDDTEKAGR